MKMSIFSRKHYYAVKDILEYYICYKDIENVFGLIEAFKNDTQNYEVLLFLPVRITVTWSIVLWIHTPNKLHARQSVHQLLHRSTI